jgi:hypothetical protein
VSSLNATHEPQDEVVSKKRKLTAQFKPPAQINPKPVNPKPVNPKPPVIIKPSAHINTNVKNVYKKPAHVKTPSGSIVITPSAHVTTSVRPSTSAKTVVKPSAHVNTFF